MANKPPDPNSKRSKKKADRRNKGPNPNDLRVTCDCGWKGNVANLEADDDSATSTLRCPLCTSPAWTFD